MPVLWFCDACGREVGALSSVRRTYGIADYKNLCGACARPMDDAALKVFTSIKSQQKRPVMGLRAWLLQYMS